MAKGKRYFDRGTGQSVQPAPGVVQVRLPGAPDDIDAALARLQEADGWETVIHVPSPDARRAPAEKVIGMLHVDVSEG